MKAIKPAVAAAALLVLLCACGTQKRAQQKAEQLKGENPAQAPTQQTSAKKILYPTNHDAEDDFYVDDQRTPTVKPRAPRTDRPEIKFTYIESANVRVAGINPLPAGGVLALDLDRMKEDFCYPYKGQFLSDYGMRNGRMHTGVDIRTVPNDTIRAAFAGVVRMSKMYSSYGNIVVIRHYEGFETVYAHASKNLVEVNDAVEAGDPIALGGRTGRATTEHLHFEVRAAGEPVDPNKLLDVRSHKLQDGMMYIGLAGKKIMAYSSPEDLKKTEQAAAAAEQARRESEARAAEGRAAAVAEAEKAAAATKVFHTVKKGDTLYGIALKNKTTVKKLCQLNGIKENSTLQINQKIRVR